MNVDQCLKPGYVRNIVKVVRLALQLCGRLVSSIMLNCHEIGFFSKMSSSVKYWPDSLKKGALAVPAGNISCVSTNIWTAW